MSAYPSDPHAPPVEDVTTVQVTPGATKSGVRTSAAASRAGSAGVTTAGQRPPQGTTVFARRWAALLVVVVVVAVILTLALRGHPPALYWQGEPMTNPGQALASGERSMERVVSADEGVMAPDSRCYFSLPTRAAHDVESRMRCGPVLLPWSEPSRPWLTFEVKGRLGSSGETIALSAPKFPATTLALAAGEVLRRPDGAAPPNGTGGLTVPAVPRQPAGWGGTLSTAPAGLAQAPVADLIGGWAQTYRLVSYGELGQLPVGLDPAALRVTVDPPGSAWATRAEGGRPARPLAKLLLPGRGEVFVVAELAVSPGESAGAVPAGAVAAGGAEAGGRAGLGPTLQLLSNGSTITFPYAVPRHGANLVLAAAVPAGSRPVLQVEDKGLAQQVSLGSGTLAPAPEVLSRGGTDEPLSVSGSVGGVTVHVSDAALVWFAGSDGGTVPPRFDEAYLEILATVEPLAGSFLPPSDFTLQLGAGQEVAGQELPDADRRAIAMGFLVPASFSDGVVGVSVNGRSFDFPVHFA